MFETLQYRLLRTIAPTDPPHTVGGSAYEGRSKLRALLGEEQISSCVDRVVLDFGCGIGAEAVELAQLGARRVIGLDIQTSRLEQGRVLARAAGVEDRCVFTETSDEPAEIVISLDAFEHYDDPESILATMHGLLKPGGLVFISFGWPWLHPYGGHLFSVFPWAHLLFSERALIRWRSDIRSDGARRFSEVEGGLNQMTLGRAERLCAASEFIVREFRSVPIRRLRWLHNRLTREFTSATVRITLQRKS